jgi:tetratricopeptide (TPR) repeat protein
MRRLGAFDEAVRVFREMLHDEPGEGWVIESLKRAYRASGLVEDLIKTYELEMAQIEDKERKGEILVTLGRIRRRLGRLEEAESDLRQALENVPRGRDAIDVLHQVYVGMDDTKGMAEMLDLKAELTTLPEERILLLLDAGSLWERADKPREAIMAYKAVREMQPEDRKANAGLARLYEALERWEDLVEVLGVQADVTRSEPEAVSLYGKLGFIWLEELGDSTRAEESFLMATEMDPEHLPSLEGLEKVARGREDWEAAVGYIDRQVAVVDDVRKRTHLNIESAKILQDVLGQPEEALTRFRGALAGDPSATEALWGVATINFDREDWAGTVDPLMKLTDRIDRKETDDAKLALMHYRCGFAMGKLDRPPEERIIQFERSLDADPDHLHSLKEAERIYFQAGRWAQAKPLVTRLLEKHGSQLGETETRKLKVDQGIVLWKTGEVKEGAQILESCSDPAEEKRALTALEDLYREAGDDDGAISVLERICASAEDEEEVARANRKIGWIFLERKGNGLKASHYFEKALEGRPADVKARRGLATSFEEAARWEEAAGAWRSLAESSASEEDRLRAWVSMGKVLLEGLGEIAQARDAFQKALSLDPAREEALKGIETTKRTLKDWKGLIADYTLALKTKKNSPEGERAPLHFKIGEAFVEARKNQEAADSLEQAVTADPSLSAAHLLLGRVYEKREATRRKAPHHYRAVLARTPRRIDALRRLCNINLKLGKKKEAFPPAAVLVAYRSHNSTEFGVYEKGKFPGLPLESSFSDDRIRRALLAPKVEGPLRELLWEVNEFLGDAAGASLARHGIRRRRKPEGISAVVNQAKTLAEAFGNPPYEILLSENPVEEGVALEYLKTPALVVGPGFDKLPRDERAFLLGRALALVREKLSTGMSDPRDLRRILVALASAYIPDAEQERGSGREEKAFRKKVRGALPRRTRKRIEPLVRAWWDQQEEEDMDDFHIGVSMTADRWGLICAGDPFAAIQAKLHFDGGLSIEEEMETSEILKWVGNAPDLREMISFAVSEEFAFLLASTRGD